MKKLLLAVALLTAAFSTAIAQSEEHKHCYTTEKLQEAIRRDPTVAQRMAQLEDFTRTWIADKAQQRSQGGIYIIPVVFHVLHNYGQENISDAQIIDAVRVMNEDFRLLNADTNLIIPQFKQIAADCEIEFRLATIDPNGNCTNGIDRIVTPLTEGADDNSKLNPWPNDMYLNIWTAKSLANAGAAAYAYYPGVSNPDVDGIISLSHYVGSIGTSNYNNSRTLSHEAGHCLNLAHPWGSTNQPGVACGDDNVSDTPETQGWTTCNINGSVCNPPIIENVQNHMDYSYCTQMFTAGQAARMQAALNSAIGGRNNLWSPSNLAATGALASPAPTCTPNADFYSSDQTACEGVALTFYDLSWNSPVSSRVWDFPGGSPSTSTDSSVVVTYPAAGVYGVTLTVTNSAGSASVTKTNFVRISGAAQTVAPVTEDFSLAPSFPGVDGYVVNQDNGQTWNRVTTVGASGSESVRIINYTNISGQIDDWITPSYDLSNMTGISLLFKVANARRNSSSNDQLKVDYSLNCGETWQPRYNKTGAALATAGVVSVSFVPNATQWRQETVSLPTSVNLKPNVRFRFRNVSDRGNNTYIDDLQITGTLVNVDEVDETTLGYALYPNPTSAASHVQFKLNKNSAVSLQVKDLTGRLVREVLNSDLGAGVHEFDIPTDGSGIYLIDLSVNGKHHIRRLVVTQD
ncbi:MAG: choice-of-anchor J domain-containing protein [Bacteroidia bacterium]|nr:choice-of-anchor J domain-containing protein [Bacteroidia bacterium]MBP7436461.1 choice-of-anchor J domain-containing protein [Bacteroidia bacterium]MBP7728054.1 choice-of-anchor J domain-containing protein [Bacteroidia bacterium]MBP7771235.1 choice-of-anchor J domain-containing protein [Bacteroidia bacterium]